MSNRDIVRLLHTVPAASGQVVGLENDLTPSLNMLMANLTSTFQVMNVYVPSLKQVLTIYPALVADLIAFAQPTASTGYIPLYFHLNVDDPPECITGFLPPDKRRNPAKTNPINTPTGLYCKVNHSDPRSVRGTRNLPCENNPGVRAATPAACLGKPEPGTGTTPAANGHEPVGGLSARHWKTVHARRHVAGRQQRLQRRRKGAVMAGSPASSGRTLSRTVAVAALAVVLVGLAALALCVVGAARRQLSIRRITTTSTPAVGRCRSRASDEVIALLTVKHATATCGSASGCSTGRPQASMINSRSRRRPSARRSRPGRHVDRVDRGGCAGEHDRRRCGRRHCREGNGQEQGLAQG